MFDWTNEEAQSIDAGLGALEAVAGELGEKQLIGLLKCRTQIWRTLRDSEQGDTLRSAAALTVKFVYAGIQKKRQIGDDNDTFFRTGLYRPEIEEAYRFGQELVRYNRLMEQSLWNRLRGKRGLLSGNFVDADCQKVINILGSHEDQLE